MRKLTVLVIAPEIPEHPLPRANVEIAAISKWMNATVLKKTVRSIDIAEAVSENRFDIIWCLGHGNTEGIELSDGLLDVTGLVQFVRKSESSLCVLNTCASENVAIDVSAQSGADVICTITEVDNKDAIRMGHLLAGEIATTSSYQEAFDIIATPGSDYRYYEAGKVARSYHREADDELLRLVYKLDAEVKLQRWLNILTLVVLLIRILFDWVRVSL